MHFANTASAALERAQLTRNLILRTIKMAEMRDPKETGTHVNRVASYSIEIYERWARKNGIDEKEITRNAMSCGWPPCSMTSARWPYQTLS